MILLTGFTGNTGSIVLEKLLKTVPANQIVGITRNTDYFNEHNIHVENVALEDEQGVEQLFKKPVVLVEFYCSTAPRTTNL